jgi:hypothetical protein
MRIGYATYTEDLNDPDPDLDWAFVNKAASSRNIEISAHDWRQPCDWGQFDAVVVRSTWDYSNHLPEFLKWASGVSAQSILLNDLATITANTNKKYLANLSDVGVATIPTIYLPPQGELGPDQITQINSWLSKAGKLAIKPSVDAGARLAGLARDLPTALERVEQIHKVSKIAMIQPYLMAVDSDGEHAVVLLGGEISHAVIKRPALTEGGHGDGLALVNIDEGLKSFCKQVAISAVKGGLTPDWSSLLYARIDAVPSPSSPLGWQLMELELTEPALFFDKCPSAAEVFIDALTDRVYAKQ